MILIQFNLEEYTIDEMIDIHQSIKNIYPKNRVITIPKGLEFSIEEKKTVQKKLQNILEELQNES